MMMPEYGLCSQTVTVYRRDEDRIIRQVLHNCYFSVQEEEIIDTLGKRTGCEFLLIVPGKKHKICCGDRVMEGVGPVITPAQWKEFVPAAVPGLTQVSYTRVCSLAGEICHTQAGHRQTARPQL